MINLKKSIFLCNTVYQVLVAVWIKYSELENKDTDIIISNHMNGYISIAENIKKTNLFQNVYTVDSLSYSRFEVEYSNKAERLFSKMFPAFELQKYIILQNDYDELFIANMDSFSQLLFSALSKKSNIKLNIFEDGLSTYSCLFKDFYEKKCPPVNRYKNILFCKICRNKYIYPNADAFYVFKSDAMQWTPGCEINELKPISCDTSFKNLINIIFNYDNMTDIYDKKYIYFEESFYADSGYMEDVELVEKIAERVGKDNIMIKIHPRNPENRFEKLGYKTNKDTSIPWEVILLNNDFSDNVLITIASTSIINPRLIFNKKMKSFSLINCLKEKPEILEGELSKCVMSFYEFYSDSINVCKSIEDIVTE